MGDVRRVTWVCGDQRVLVEEVVDTIRERLAPGPLDYISVSYSNTFDRDVWAAASQYPLNPGSNRLIVVRDAEKLARPQRITDWLCHTRRLPKVYLLFVSNDSVLPGKKNELTNWAKALRAPRGHLVRCSTLSPEAAVAWARRRSAGLDDSAATYLLTRTGGDLATVAGVCAKLNLFAGRVSAATIDQLCAESPQQDLADNLLAGKKKLALLCLPGLSEQDSLGLLSLLDSRIDLLHSLHRHQSAGRSWRDIQGISPFLIRQYMPLARDYDTARCSQRRRALASTEEALRAGARTGVLEGLIALW